jgi:inorganic pyrophosphatase
MRAAPLAAKRAVGAKGPAMRAVARRATLRTSAPCRMAYTSEPKGDFPSMDYRIFFKEDGKTLSPWHDIPLRNADGTFNAIIEIPKETMAKMEVATDEASTPIKQDTKKGKLRDYPYNINWNYGMLPQTWEDPAHKNPDVENMAGDNDPVDIVEIGSVAHPMGSVIKVKALGVFAMIDDGELDWKVIVIDVNDPKAKELNDVADVEKVFPGELEKIRVWFRDYKMPDGKPANAFGLNDVCMDKAYTLKVIEETEGFWKALKSGKRENTEELSLN